ncbi:PrsW family intramembrane metalloprotease [Prochlorococcus marinus]|uniref:PrsW family intramembrane metalloprotease n=1 Tax=Prochlorococcus marinus TaxID=1219 RepID=UPI0022B4CC51|nr:PrsW family glutamic-type intramembrane protease [Prochlorococcus marinus]
MPDKNNAKQKESWKDSLNIADEIGRIGGGEGLGDFNFKRFFGGIYKDHSEEEVEQSLIVGTSTTTPSIENISLDYPQPWLFFRLITGSVILFYSFIAVYDQFENANLLPGIIFTGSFAVPISTLFLFFELNIRRNVPIWQVMRLVLSGGLLSLFIALVLFQNVAAFEGPSGAWVAGLLEEPAKLIALVVLIKDNKKYPYILNGLLLGAAVGCGFAAFESAGYALRLGMTDIDSLVQIIQLRGVLSPFAHIVWTAIAGAALWRVQRGGEFSFGLLFKKEFFAPFLTVVFCHAIWNSGSIIPFWGKFIICGVIAWTVALSLLNLGIKQIADEKAGKKVFRCTN